ncbi:MAG: hypothetical protein RLY70_4514 [Planctomycetota bacterium]
MVRKAPSCARLRGGQVFLQEDRAFLVAFGRIKFAAADLLEVSGLGLEEETVHGGDIDVGDQLEIDPQAHAGQQQQGFLAADCFGGAKDAERSADAIVEFFVVVFEQRLAGLAFVFEQLRHDFGDAGDELFFGLSQGELIADLVEISEGLGAFAVESADGEMHFLQAAKHFVDLAAQDQSGQVEHDAYSQARADIGGAGGEVAELFVEGERQAFFEQVVEVIDLAPSGFEVKPAVHDLQSQMVFFVDHQAERLLRLDNDRARAFGFGEFAADQLAFDEELAVDIAESLDVDVFGAAPGVDFGHAFADKSGDRSPLGFGAAADEGEFGEVAGQANPAAYDDVRIGAGAAEPLAAATGQGVKFHEFVPSLSSFRI